MFSQPGHPLVDPLLSYVLRGLAELAAFARLTFAPRLILALCSAGTLATALSYSTASATIGIAEAITSAQLGFFMAIAPAAIALLSAGTLLGLRALILTVVLLAAWGIRHMAGRHSSRLPRAWTVRDGIIQITGGQE